MFPKTHGLGFRATGHSRVSSIASSRRLMLDSSFPALNGRFRVYGLESTQ